MTFANKPADMLEQVQFQEVVAATPLISIDLIVRNSLGQVLLGLRLNRPAQGFWFVPGGRVRKDESLDDAFMRLANEELGITYIRAHATFLGPYEHFYDDNFSGDSFSTHYIVLGYELRCEGLGHKLPVNQHERYRWFDVSELINDPNVHQYSKNYFIGRM
ncbi:GDP-mannose mannosyl hydrolase [Citrobacter werkmanii]|uniref:GDP-mannose mannosyl hydrolase n=1 Tax=Citrobacter werkmanii TaxID=67827 RepID=UPI00264A7CE7|nr:GDP-mannose mannosyl hydrolase [Citrobacter werkmanii]MDN8555940.1 GDP-mannose mannosyl hydrolase [Citrobacter werkmanii]